MRAIHWVDLASNKLGRDDEAPGFTLRVMPARDHA